MRKQRYLIMITKREDHRPNDAPSSNPSIGGLIYQNSTTREIPSLILECPPILPQLNSSAIGSPFFPYPTKCPSLPTWQANNSDSSWEGESKRNKGSFLRHPFTFTGYLPYPCTFSCFLFFSLDP